MHFDATNFLQHHMRRYYSQVCPEIPELANRECMFELFSGKVIRYKQFATCNELQAWLQKYTPKGAYFSVCLFERPAIREGYLRADVPVEFDLSEYAKGKPKFRCTYNHDSRLYCDKCYEFMVAEAVKLRDILFNDFGLAKHDLITKFSGSRGFHFLITAQEYRELDSPARGALVKYLLGEGITLAGAGFTQIKIRGRWVWAGPTVKSAGWSGRAAKALLNILGVPNNEPDIKWHKILGNISGKKLQQLIEQAVRQYRVEVDGKVTVDTKRMFRMPDSVHGGAGLIAKSVPPDKIEEFMPYKHAVITADDEKVRLVLLQNICIVMGGVHVRGAANSEVELPLGLALPLVARGLAKPLV